MIDRTIALSCSFVVIVDTKDLSILISSTGSERSEVRDE